MHQIDQSNMPIAARDGRKFRNDLILVGVLLLVIAVVGLCLFLFQTDGDTVIVEVNGKTFGTYALSEPRTVEIRTGEGGEELNLLVIRDGTAYVETATCPDGICAAHKPISHEGESIICLPHQVVIRVQRTQKDGAPDVAA